MIKRYSDHAANERTFLAWVRTAIALMAFGFVIEKFDLFLQYVAPQLAKQQFAAHSQSANLAGLAFILLGVAMTAIAGFRFVRTAREIDSEDVAPSPGSRFDLAQARQPRGCAFAPLSGLRLLDCSVGDRPHGQILRAAGRRADAARPVGLGA